MSAISELDAVRAERDRLRAENEAMRKEAEAKEAKAKRSLVLKVSAKGALSLYGMGRFPVTLYKDQWIKLLGMGPDVVNFIKANDSKLGTKDNPVFHPELVKAEAKA